MKYRFDGYNWLVRLEKGESFVDSLTQLIKDEKIGGAWLSGLGAVTSVELGFYNADSKDFTWKKFDYELEIASLQGNVAWMDDAPILHVHGSFSDNQMQTVSGHVKDFKVSGTCEILFHRWYQDGLSRFHDYDTNLNLLDL